MDAKAAATVAALIASGHVPLGFARLVPGGTVPDKSVKVIPPVCIHLGAVLPNQAKVACAQRRRDCSEFGECSLSPVAGIEHHCTDERGNAYDADGKPICPGYVPRD